MAESIDGGAGTMKSVDGLGRASLHAEAEPSRSRELDINEDLSNSASSSPYRNKSPFMA